MAIVALEESYLEVLVYAKVGQWREEERRGEERQDDGVLCREPCICHSWAFIASETLHGLEVSS